MKARIQKQAKWLTPVLVAVWLIGIGVLRAPLAMAYERQTSKEKGVRVEVVPVQVEPGRQIRFEVRMNTHSVPLDHDLMAVSVLDDGAGNLIEPVNWEGSPPGGHHRRGILSFPELSDRMEMMTLIIQDVSGVEKRKFQWTITIR